MSEVENAPTGADAAPVPDAPANPEVVQETPQVTADADTPKDDQPRDEKGKFVQKRINELTREKHEARRQAEQYQRELEQARQELARARQPAAPDPNEDFPAYVRHLASEEARNLVEQERTSWQQQQQQQYYQSLAEQHSARETEYANSHPDYIEAVDAFTSIAGVNPYVAEVLMTSDHGPAVVHFLGQHLDEASRILAMPPHMAAAAIARIEARVSAPKPKPVTNAPTPAPILGGGSVVPTAIRDGMDYEEYKRLRQGS